jgi:hypothetical protein
MGKPPKLKPHQKKSYFAEQLEKKESIINLKTSEDFLISLKHYDINQGATFEQWEQGLMLAQALRVLQGYCTSSMDAQFGDKFTIYDGFPQKDKTDFYHPKHVPPDAKWGRIHVNGTQIIAGHIVGNVFYWVFSDSNHRFYITEKKNT